MNSIFNVKDHMLAGSRLLGLPDCPLIKVKDPVLRSYLRKGKWRHREDTWCDEIHSSDMRLGRGESRARRKERMVYPSICPSFDYWVLNALCFA